MLDRPIAFVDIETTGLDRDIHEIIELGAVICKMKEGVFKVVDEVNLKIQPKYLERADPVALRVNGYNEADWLFAVSIEDALKDFIKKTEGAIFAAHNITFDYGFIETALKQHNLEHLMHFHKIDTISVAFAALHASEADISKYSLRALCEHFGIDNKKAHSAHADAYATYELFKVLLKLS